MQTPTGYQYAPCPPLATEEEQRALKGRKILAAHLLDGATGWFMGTVQAFGVGPAWKQPDATHIVVYKQAETKTKDLNGRVACKLSAANYGTSECTLNGGCFWSRKRDTVIGVRSKRLAVHLQFIFYACVLEIGWLAACV